jgi:hypothetical protein
MRSTKQSMSARVRAGSRRPPACTKVERRGDRSVPVEHGDERASFEVGCNHRRGRRARPSPASAAARKASRSSVAKRPRTATSVLRLPLTSVHLARRRLGFPARPQTGRARDDPLLACAQWHRYEGRVWQLAEAERDVEAL